MREPMEGARGFRQEAPRVLVLALRSALEEPDAALDAEFKRLVVARLEMKAGHMLDASPVAPVEGRRPEDVQRGGDGLRVALRDHQQEVVGHAARDLAEELAREVGRR